MAFKTFREWLEHRDESKPWKSEETKEEYLAWESEVQTRLAAIRNPSENLASFINRQISSVKHCSKYIPGHSGAFHDLCISKREEDFARQMSRGSFEDDLSRAAGTWADGLDPRELGTAYLVLFGKKIPKPRWVDTHQGTTYIPHTRQVRRPGAPDRSTFSYTDYDTEFYNHETGRYEPRKKGPSEA